MDFDKNKTASEILGQLDIDNLDMLKKKNDRMEIATAAMQGMLSDQNMVESLEAVAEVSVKMADLLLAELNKE